MRVNCKAVVYKDQFNSFRLGLTSSISTSGAAFPTVNDLESLSIQIISWRSEENGGGGRTDVRERRRPSRRRCRGREEQLIYRSLRWDTASDRRCPSC